MTAVFALLALLVAERMPEGARMTYSDSLPRWLVGCWEHTTRRERSTQRWTAAGPAVLFGAAWTVRGDSLVALDVMRLSAHADSLVLDRVPADRFPESLRGRSLRSSEGAAAVFEGTDAVTRVRFSERETNGLRVRYERAGEAVDPSTERTYRRVACGDLPRQDADAGPAMKRLHSADERAVVAGDADALERLWTDDIVALAPGSPPRSGRQSNAAAMRLSLAQSRELLTVGYRLSIVDVHVVGDHAIEWGHYEGRVRARADTTIITARGSMLRVIRRGADGSWRVARTMFTAE